MNFKAFINLYDNWNGIIRVNDNNLDTIIEGKVDAIMSTRTDLFNSEVVAFGYYDGILTVRIRTEILLDCSHYCPYYECTYCPRKYLCAIEDENNSII